MQTVGSLFAGIGGFDLGLERAGLRIAWQAEIEPYACEVLRERWPGVPNHGDVRGIRAGSVEPVDVICGGFPCQAFSTAARGRNNAADLWPEMLRIVSELRPRWVLGENVPGLGMAGVDRVCADLERAGYAAWPVDVDTAPHGRQRERRRFLFLAHANGQGEPRCPEHAEVARVSGVPARRWSHDPAPVGMDDGLPARMDRLRCLGGAITPFAAELLGRAILSAAP